jgi:methylenetetrahydrofolate dehydrogenase (NADP+)/methenyltetrahydrofolate cyclohydrolase
VEKSEAGAVLLDGAAVARRLRERAREAAAAVAAAAGSPPFLRVILAGSNPASETYVASKTRAAREAGIGAETIRLPDDASPEAMLAEVARANREPHVDGLLVQLPLPPGHDVRRVIDAIDPHKDVDGFHPENVGRLLQERPRFVPCTPAGILELLDAYGIAVSGARAVVLGRSDIVGKPMAALLTARNATVTICHSRTRELAAVCREAELLVAAVGRPGLVTAEFVRPGAVVVDVGINRLCSLAEAPAHLRASPRLQDQLSRRGWALVGDVDFEGVSHVARAITPVPGGVGPLTVAMLLANTVKSAEMRRCQNVLKSQATST